MDRLEYNFDVLSGDSLPVDSYRLKQEEVFKFDNGFWFVHDLEVARKTSFYLGFRVFHEGVLFGKLLLHEKRQKQLARLCLDKNILYTTEPREWLSIIDLLKVTLCMKEKGAYYIEIALDTVKQLRKKLSHIYHHSTLNDECIHPIYKPNSKIDVSTLNNNQQYVVGSHSYNMTVYEKGKNLDDLLTKYFLNNQFEPEELTLINRAELRMKRNYLTQIKDKFDLSLEGLCDEQNLRSIFSHKVKKFTRWNDLEVYSHDKNNNKKYRTIDLLGGIPMGNADRKTKTVKYTSNVSLYQKDTSKDIVRRLLDQYLKSGNCKFLVLLKESADECRIEDQQLKKLITNSFESVGQEVPETVLNAVFSNADGSKTKVIGRRLVDKCSRYLSQIIHNMKMKFL